MKIKGFDKDLCCRGFQFEIGHEYEIEHDGRKLELCSDTVFHYCDSLQNVHKHYSVSEDNRFCEIEVLGEEVTDGEKCGSDHIKILREITGEELEIMKGIIDGNSGIFNTGDRNTGDRNTGNRNTGDRNTGDRNTGDRNTGDRNTGSCNTGSCNTGDWNTGDWNTGNWNTGDQNTGSCNTGDWNTGNRNTGDWNTTNHNTGCFCTEEHSILFFDRESSITYIDWINSDARYLMQRIDFRPTEWIDESGMTEEEKEEYPTYKTTGGYLRTRDLSCCYAEWWGELDEMEKQTIKEIPNFDGKKFEEITGINVNG